MGSDAAVSATPPPRSAVPATPSIRPTLRVAGLGLFSRTREGSTTVTVLTRLKALQNRCKLTERSFHSLRHYFCTTLIRRGASVEAVRQLAGHSGLAVTQRYVHATAADLQGAIAKLSGN